MNAASPVRRVNWRQEHLHLTITLMTAFWMAGWVALSLNWFIRISLSTALGLSAVHLLASTVVVRWMVYRRAQGGTILFTVVLLMSTAAGITALLMPQLAHAYDGGDLKLSSLFYLDREAHVPGGPIVVFWVLLLWWRGYQLGDVYMTLVRASFGLRLGLLSYLWVILLAGHVLRTEALATIPFFFFFGLLGSSLARADSLNLDRAGHTGAMGRGWILSLVGLALAVSLSGYVAALWLSGMDLAQAGKAFQLLAEGALTLLFLLASPVLLIVQLVYDFIRGVMPDHAAGTRTRPTSQQRDQGQSLQAPWLEQALKLLSDALIAGLLIFVVLALLGLIWFLILGRARGREYRDEERETLGTGEVVGGLRQSLLDGWRRLVDALGLFRQFGVGRDLFAALTIRRIYARMEKLAGTRGYPRALAETPYEYRRTLAQAFPQQNADVQIVTEAYVAVRYGDVPESSSALEVVRAAWLRLQASSPPDSS